MALSNLEGSTIGGLDEGRGHNARILAFSGEITLTDVSTGAAIFGVDKDGTVTSSNSDIALAVTYGHGLTLEMPELHTSDSGSTFELTFGVSGTSAATVSTEQIKIQVATVNATFNDGGTMLALPVGVHTVSGNQIKFTIGDPTDEGVTNIDYADGDKVVLNVLAFAIPA